MKATIGGTRFRIVSSAFRGRISWRAEVASLSSLSDRDPYYHPLGGIFDTPAEARADCEDYAAHMAEAKKLMRLHVSSTRRSTPWGESQGETQYAPGVVFYSTASHGGFKLSQEANSVIPEIFRNADGWYEEDCEAAIVSTFLPGLFTAREVRKSHDTLVGWYPDEYEKHFGVVIEEGRSHKKDERLFLERHKGDWIVISAVREGDQVVCTATKGGLRGSGDEPRKFMVPAEEYAGRSTRGFVIDLDRHPEQSVGAAAPRMG